MKFSHAWLRDYVELGDDPKEAADALTRVGFSVELIEEHRTSTGTVDHVLDIEVTTNRPDAMNHVGLARELAVALDLELRLPEGAEPATEADGDALGARVIVESPELCPRFSAKVIEGVTVGPSPAWLVDRLEAIGQRSINNVVDVTNYLLWEWGQPQHAYDLATLDQQTIVVRTARAGERVVTLDGEERELDEGMLLICDPSRPIGIAGVMGGLDTEVGEATTTVLLESAWFDPVSVRQTARSLGMHTDASHRFERGADYALALRANERACRLIAELGGGTVRPGAIDARADDRLPKHSTIELEPKGISAFAGCEIADTDAERWLRGLGFVVRAEGERWQVTPPSWRALDVERGADLYEEVLRHFGYDEIPAALPAIAGADRPPTARQKRRRLLRDHLIAAGFAEAIDWAFHDRAADASLPRLVEGGAPDGGPVTLANPLSERYEVMRRSLLPGLLESARFNVRRGADEVRLFEVGHVFGDRELEAVGMIAGGRPELPWQQRSAVDLFDLKGVVEHLAESLGASLEARPASATGLVEGAAAELWGEIGGRPERIGVLGQVDDDDAPYPLFVAELLTDGLGTEESLGRLGKTHAVEPPSRFPGIVADLTLTHPLEVEWRQLVTAIEEHRAAGEMPELASYALKDRYRGKGVPEGAVNTTLTFVYSSRERSLTQEEINAQHQGLARVLERRFAPAGG